MTTEEAVLALRDDPQFADLIRDAYLGPDARGNAERFLASAEFHGVLGLLDRRVRDATVLDVGAGTGIASFAFARTGAKVVALEPDPSGVVGQGAIHQVSDGLPIAIVAGVGEALPFPDEAFDVVYARQVLHHARDLDALVRECARVAAAGGLVIATREHVAEDEAELAAFLAAHPVHRLAGGEHAYPLAAYVRAFRRAGLGGPRILGPYDSIVNAFPAFHDELALRRHPTSLLEGRFGRLGRLSAAVPGIPALVRWWLTSRVPGRLYSFVGRKP
ncbi:MAG TPA: class I SAM-dependent methyltransferase [Anaeromyxobacter sp.]